MANALLEKMQAAGSTPSATLADSIYFNAKDAVRTHIPIINAAFSAALDGGITSGLTMIAGPSKHFKSNLGLVAMKAYLNKYPDAIALLYDSEFGVTPPYIAANGIDPNRVVHIPIVHVEQLKFDIVKRIEAITRDDKVFIFVDSIGNLASKKEAEDALEGDSKTDMTRAKSIKSLFRIITPYLTLKDIPCVVINHTYLEQGAMYPRQIVSGGTGIYLSADNIWIIGRQQEKDGTDIVGWNFTINIEKSRFVKEKSKFTFQVTYENGISRWSGLLDLALETGHVTNVKKGRYALKGQEKGVLEKDTHTKEFWGPILLDPAFRQHVVEKYRVASPVLRSTVDDELEDIFG